MGGAYPWGGPKDPLTIPVGALRHKIDIQQQTGAKDALGGLQNAWTTTYSTLGAIATVSMREVWQTAQFVQQVTHRITLRWPGQSIVITGGMRVRYAGRVFQVQSVENVQERHRLVHLLCQEINGDASA